MANVSMLRLWVDRCVAPVFGVSPSINEALPCASILNLVDDDMLIIFDHFMTFVRNLQPQAVLEYVAGGMTGSKSHATIKTVLSPESFATFLVARLNDVEQAMLQESWDRHLKLRAVVEQLFDRGTMPVLRHGAEPWKLTVPAMIQSAQQAVLKFDLTIDDSLVRVFRSVNKFVDSLFKQQPYYLVRVERVSPTLLRMYFALRDLESLQIMAKLGCEVVPEAGAGVKKHELSRDYVQTAWSGGATFVEKASERLAAAFRAQFDPSMQARITTFDKLVNVSAFVKPALGAVTDTEVYPGTIVYCNSAKGYGFIKPDSLLKDNVFFHFSEVYGTPCRGDQVTFCRKLAPKPGKPLQACLVRLQRRAA
eukprot:TRINITY_DN10165_c0_g1_i1.p1 TRINITY_DN10165_c0_g1~~TRINITY_DN10165_c0_g1_i1.p1  ORF type:complete len:365 (+),score=86.15 TRINITY_DN10165_c0_g1_i1:55-1149(+)